MEGLLVGTPVLVALIATALLFDFLNGLHDSANSIATVVATRVLRPFTAVLWASFFNFIAFTVFGLHVAETMGSGVVDAKLVDPLVIFGALSGAITWNVVTWRFGIPSSSSHALVGGLIGAAVAKSGPVAVIWGGVGVIGSAIVLSPLIGLVLAMTLVLVTSWLCVRATPFRGGSPLPGAAVRLLGAVEPGPWRQRRAEDHGHHHRAALLAEPAERRLPCPALGRAELPERDGARHSVRRLAHRADHGLEDHPSDADAGVLRRRRRRAGVVRRDLARHSGVDHAHDHRVDRGRRFRSPGLGRAMERCPRDRSRLGDHHSGVGHRRCLLLRVGAAHRWLVDNAGLMNLSRQD